jgi:hypothetical protein
VVKPVGSGQAKAHGHLDIAAAGDGRAPRSVSFCTAETPERLKQLVFAILGLF